MKESLLLLVLIRFLSSCTDHGDKKYHEATFLEEAKELKKAGELTDEEVQIMVDSITPRFRSV